MVRLVSSNLVVELYPQTNKSHALNQKKIPTLPTALELLLLLLLLGLWVLQVGLFGHKIGGG